MKANKKISNALYNQSYNMVGIVVKSNKNFSLIQSIDGDYCWIDRYTTRQIINPYKRICKFLVNKNELDYCTAKSLN